MDPEGEKASKNVTFTINPVNDAPVASSQSYSIREGNVLKVSVSDGPMSGVRDPDGEKPVSVQTVQKPQNGKVSPNELNGSFEYLPNKDFSGYDEFTFKVKDAGGAYSKVETARINVTFKMKDLRSVSAPSAKKEDPPPPFFYCVSYTRKPRKLLKLSGFTSHLFYEFFQLQ